MKISKSNLYNLCMTLKILRDWIGIGLLADPDDENVE
jgi:hypothetical protein